MIIFSYQIGAPVISIQLSSVCSELLVVNTAPFEKENPRTF